MVKANDGMTGFHIHVAEGMNDVYDSLRHYGCRPVNRLLYNGVLGEKTMLGHCSHISPAEMDILRETGTMVCHNPESNMGNAVGCSPVLQLFQKLSLIHISFRTGAVPRRSGKSRPPRPQCSESTGGYSRCIVLSEIGRASCRERV